MSILSSCLRCWHTNKTMATLNQWWDTSYLLLTHLLSQANLFLSKNIWTKLESWLHSGTNGRLLNIFQSTILSSLLSSWCLSAHTLLVQMDSKKGCSKSQPKRLAWPMLEISALTQIKKIKKRFGIISLMLWQEMSFLTSSSLNRMMMVYNPKMRQHSLKSSR